MVYGVTKKSIKWGAMEGCQKGRGCWYLEKGGEWEVFETENYQKN